MVIRIGSGFDVHKFDTDKDTDSIRLSGIDIPHPQGLKGHSDADVVLHAITDAILGALALGDIGDHFPPSDEQWRGVDSAVFLQHANTLIGDKNYRINNIDVTIICEAPKIGPHRDAMRARVADILQLDVDHISIKATTSEGLGFTGRREGIACQAVVLVEQQ